MLNLGKNAEFLIEDMKLYNLDGSGNIVVYE
jgi:hypothetical protein